MMATLRSFWVAREGGPEELLNRFVPTDSVEFEIPDGDVVLTTERTAAGWMVTTIRYVTGEE